MSLLLSLCLSCRVFSGLVLSYTVLVLVLVLVLLLPLPLHLPCVVFLVLSFLVVSRTACAGLASSNMTVHASSCLAQPCLASLCLALQFRRHLMSGLSMPRHAMPRHVMSYFVVSHSLPCAATVNIFSQSKVGIGMVNSCMVVHSVSAQNRLLREAGLHLSPNINVYDVCSSST